MKKHLSEIMNIKKLQSLMEKFTNATGVGTAILDLEGEVLVASGWQEICTDFHRVNPITCENCLQSDTVLSNDLMAQKSYNQYRCLNGLVDVAVPIIINENHLGNLFIGQFLSQEPDLDFFRNQAKQYGFDENKYMNALSKVQILSEDDVKSKIDFLLELAMLVGDLGEAKLKTEVFAEGLEQKIKERVKDLKEAQIASLNIMQDAVEARKESEELNEQLSTAMQNLTRSNQELEQFAYVASHDLQEPLRMVSSYTQLLERRYKDKLDQDAKDFIHYAVDGASRMQVLINDLLQYSRISTRGKEFEKTDMNVILGETIVNLKGTIVDSLAVVTNDELPILTVDTSQISRLLQNLISNAIKYRSDEIPHIHIASFDETEYFKFCVSDNGIGIAPEYFNRIFEIFERLHAKDKYGGTGIGLAICKRIIQRHKGEIWVESEEGKGSKFYFTIKKNL